MSYFSLFNRLRSPPPPNFSFYRPVLCGGENEEQVPRLQWFCDHCRMSENDVKTSKGCDACGDSADNDNILLCDGCDGERTLSPSHPLMDHKEEYQSLEARAVRHFVAFFEPRMTCVCLTVPLDGITTYARTVCPHLVLRIPPASLSFFSPVPLRLPTDPLGCSVSKGCVVRG